MKDTTKINSPGQVKVKNNDNKPGWGFDKPVYVSGNPSRSGPKRGNGGKGQSNGYK